MQACHIYNLLLGFWVEPVEMKSLVNPKVVDNKIYLMLSGQK
jgi:hypothetical protein